MYVMTFVRVTTFSALACKRPLLQFVYLALVLGVVPGDAAWHDAPGRKIWRWNWKEMIFLHMEVDNSWMKDWWKHLIFPKFMYVIYAVCLLHTFWQWQLYYIYIIYNLNICKGCNNIHKALRSLPQKTQEWRFLVLHFVAVNLHISYYLQLAFPLRTLGRKLIQSLGCHYQT